MSHLMIDPAIEAAHETLWARFVDSQHVVLDYVGLNGELHRPTPEECLLCKPNAMSWGCPNENGSFFGGLYLEAMINRFRLTRAPEDREHARQIAQGLMVLASVGQVRGFIARGTSDDGCSHFPIGSNDQTTPWLYGMWRYLSSDLPQREERAAITAKFIEVAEVLESTGWQTPCDRPPFDFRNCLATFQFENTPRLLWLCRAMSQMTDDTRWEDNYEAALAEEDPEGGLNRLGICRRGMVWEHGGPHSWISSNSVAALRGLWEMETDGERKAAYAEGLRHSLELASDSLPLTLQFDNDDQRHFSCDWRVMNELWHEQHTIPEVVDLGRRQCARLAQVSPRWPYECRLVREPLFAAWVISVCPDAALVATQKAAIMATLRHYRYERLYVSTFFPAELAYYQLHLSNGGAER
ncbi:MAG: hypothetical protein ACYC63_12195 [Armatimonadota bacterium]